MIPPLSSPHWMDNYLDGHGIDPVTLHAQLEGVEPDEPIWAGVDAGHDAYQGVIAVEEGPRHARPLPLGHGGARERVEGAGRVPVRVHPVRSSGLHVQSHPARQPFSQPVQSVGGVVRSTCETGEREKKKKDWNIRFTKRILYFAHPRKRFYDNRSGNLVYTI